MTQGHPRSFKKVFKVQNANVRVGVFLCTKLCCASGPPSTTGGRAVCKHDDNLSFSSQEVRFSVRLFPSGSVIFLSLRIRRTSAAFRDGDAFGCTLRLRADKKGPRTFVFLGQKQEPSDTLLLSASRCQRGGSVIVRYICRDVTSTSGTFKF